MSASSLRLDPASSATHLIPMTDNTLTPREIVSELNRHIVAQGDAKRAVAIALRNRWRRRRVPADYEMKSRQKIY